MLGKEIMFKETKLRKRNSHNSAIMCHAHFHANKANGKFPKKYMSKLTLDFSRSPFGRSLTKSEQYSMDSLNLFI